MIQRDELATDKIKNHNKHKINKLQNHQNVKTKVKMNTEELVITKELKKIGTNKEVILFVIAQSRLETANFTSNIYKENQNLFGMKLAKTRPTTAMEENQNHAKYRNIEESVQDYILWLTYFGYTQKHLNNLEKFKERLLYSNYSITNDYIKRIENIYNQINKQ